MNLIVGNGLIGRNLYYRMRGGAVMTTRRVLDLSRDGWIIPRCNVAYICAGVTSTIECEEHPEKSRLVNVTNTLRLAEKLDGRVIFLSSERVFDGSKPFRGVGEKVCPTTEYGRQKAEVEKGLLEMGGTVVRLSKVIGWEVPLFEGWIENLKLGLPIHPFSNMSMSPMPVAFVTDVIKKLGESGITGLYQISALEDISYDRVGGYIATYMGVEPKLVEPVLAKEAHPYTTLDSNLIKLLGLNVPDAWWTIHKWCDARCR